MTFPHVRPDGTFTIRIDFASSRALDEKAVDDWLASWVQANDPWERTWRGAGRRIVQVERLRFGDAFPEPPKCAEVTTSSVSIELTGRATRAYYWKDWMARMIDDAVRELGLEFVRAVDADSPSPGAE
jgi:hypothetical protein